MVQPEEKTSRDTKYDAVKAKNDETLTEDYKRTNDVYDVLKNFMGIQ